MDTIAGHGMPEYVEKKLLGVNPDSGTVQGEH